MENRLLRSVLGLASRIVLAAALAQAVCAHASDRELASAAVTAAPHAGSEIAIRALALVGVDYQLGGNDRDSGLDCSGLVHLVFVETFGVRMPRTTEELPAVGVAVSRRALEPGDLVFFNTRRRAHSHVGIYVGQGRFVHAPSRGSRVRVDALSARYWARRFDGARRIDLAAPEVVPGTGPVHLAAATHRTTARVATALAPDGGDPRHWSGH